MSAFQLRVLLLAGLLTCGIMIIVGPPRYDGRTFVWWRRLTNERFHPHYSWCERCARTWDIVGTNYHDTVFWTGRQNIGESSTNNAVGFGFKVELTERGYAPLCEPCWIVLGSPQARLPYYRRPNDPDWLAIKQAVLQER